MELQLLGKHRLVLAYTDDLVASQIFGKKEWNKLLGPKPDGKLRSSEFVVVQQSWNDYATFGAHEMRLVTDESHHVKVFSLNNLEVKLSLQSAGNIPFTQLRPNGKDHSKWFVFYPYGADEAQLS